MYEEHDVLFFESALIFEHNLEKNFDSIIGVYCSDKLVYKRLKDRNGFDDKDVIAESSKTRGSFLDILDASGVDTSNVKINNSILEKGSGPLHAIIRIEGDYVYKNKDNNSSPFVLRIHAYAGKSYIKVLHSIVYTGDPDMHNKMEGQYMSIATQNKSIVDEQKLKGDKGWMIPNDRIADAGFQLNYKLDANKIKF